MRVWRRKPAVPTTSTNNIKHSYQFIADELGYIKSAIYYEVQYGLYDHLDSKTWLTVKRYSATIAQDYTNYQATAKGVSIKLGKV